VRLFDEEEEYGNRLQWVQDFIHQQPDAVLVIGCSGTLSVLWSLLDDCRQPNQSKAVAIGNPIKVHCGRRVVLPRAAAPA